ncbi:TetR/AcrR family transcriptional regulator [Geodermatophilus sp. SYSU D00697]
MHRRFDWDSPSARLVLSAALDALVDVGYAGLTVQEIRARAGSAGPLIEEDDLEEIVATALERVHVFDVPTASGDLRADLAALVRPWLAARRRDDQVVTAVLSAAEWSPRIKHAVTTVFDRPLAQAVGTVLAAAVANGQVAPSRVHTLNWILRGLALDRMRASNPRSPVDLEELVDHLVSGLGPSPA